MAQIFLWLPCVFKTQPTPSKHCLVPADLHAIFFSSDMNTCRRCHRFLHKSGVPATRCSLGCLPQHWPGIQGHPAPGTLKGHAAPLGGQWPPETAQNSGRPSAVCGRRGFLCTCQRPSGGRVAFLETVAHAAQARLELSAQLRRPACLRLYNAGITVRSAVQDCCGDGAQGLVLLGNRSINRSPAQPGLEFFFLLFSFFFFF